MRWGAGAGASRLISGNMEPHRQLESRLAEFKGYEAALLFGSGYLANTGAIAALAGRGRGRLLRRAQPRQHHRRLPALAGRDLRLPPRRPRAPRLGPAQAAGGRGSLIVTDGVFSMDGDVAPLPELLELARRHDCRLMVDEAHATGALGPGGRGSVAAAGLSGEVDVVVGTLGKALGSYGAYVCANAETIDYLVNTARPFVFSTAPPPPSVAAATAALELLVSPDRVERLRANASGAARGTRRRGPRGGPLPDPDRADRGRRRRAHDGALRAPPRARRLRPGDPPADRCRGLLAPALHGDGHPPPR